ncbi:MAG: type II toxin-antitoxin system RatA family toxin [Pseudomonadota bacterium]
MPTHSENRVMPYTPQQMFDLIADVASYPQFLPWCAAARIRSRDETPAGEVMDADLVISFKVFRERFTSRVTMRPEDGQIDVEYLDGPFKYLINSWSFVPDDGGTRVKFHVDFEFRSRALQAVIGVVFYEAMRRIVSAFEKRAAVLYGSTPQIASA